ncbi:unnamed protein product, partial [marine sediment metagenome]
FYLGIKTFEPEIRNTKPSELVTGTTGKSKRGKQ